MLLVSVQNPVTKESKTAVVVPGDAGEFLRRCVPDGCIALVQDVAVYVGEVTTLEIFTNEVAPDIYDESFNFKKKWYGQEK